MARHNSRKFNRIRTADVLVSPARKPVTPTSAPLKIIGESRHVFTARPDDVRLVSWHDHEQKRLQIAVSNAVKAESNWKTNKHKTK